VSAILQVPRAEEFLQFIQRELPEKIARHSESVADMMLEIAETQGFSDEDAVTAGLLHDLCKTWNGERLIDAAEQYEIPVTDAQRHKPNLLHGPVAAARGKKELDVASEPALDAICWHTTGREGLGPVGLALFVADFSEPLRAHPEAAEARQVLAQDGFLAALCFVAERKLAHLKGKPFMDPTTQAFARWLRDNHR
jgi:predicted HD superfamily hydrolase involved in NAD metabolism